MAATLSSDDVGMTSTRATILPSSATNSQYVTRHAVCSAGVAKEQRMRRNQFVLAGLIAWPLVSGFLAGVPLVAQSRSTGVDYADIDRDRDGVSIDRSDSCGMK